MYLVRTMIPVNLISDTVTKPTPGMLQAMLQAEVGDDVFRQDPTTQRLESMLAELFGKEAGLFCPSGTQTNQLAIKAQTQPLDEILCDRISHIYRYELGGYGFISGVSLHVMEGKNGIVSVSDVKKGIKPKADWNPRTKLLCLENTINMGGGNYYTLNELKQLSDAAKEAGLLIHLDGARIFNALVESGDSPVDHGQLFDTISICLSKGLGAPVGSVLIGSHAVIDEARRFRKVLGGGMRQSGYLAAAGIYALQHHIDRLKMDHQHAQTAADHLSRVSWVEEVLPTHTNIVIFKCAKNHTASEIVTKLAKYNVLCSPLDQQWVRWVFHLDVSSEQVSYLLTLPDILE